MVRIDGKTSESGARLGGYSDPRAVAHPRGAIRSARVVCCRRASLGRCRRVVVRIDDVPGDLPMTRRKAPVSLRAQAVPALHAFCRAYLHEDALALYGSAAGAVEA